MIMRTIPFEDIVNTVADLCIRGKLEAYVSCHSLDIHLGLVSVYRLD